MRSLVFILSLVAGGQVLAKGGGDGGWFVSAYYSMADQVKGDGDGNLNGTAFDFDIVVETKGAPGIGLGYQKSFGGFLFEAGSTYDFARELDTLRLTINGSSAAFEYSEPKPKVAIVSPFLNLGFRLTDRLYLLGGALLPVFIYSEDNDESETKGKISYQAGLGINITSNIHIEAVYRVLNVKESATFTDDGDTLTLEAKESLKGVNIGLKWIM